MRIKLLALCLLALVSSFGAAQFDYGFGGAPEKPAWEEFKLNPKTRIKLEFRNANIDMILSLYQKLSGITIVKDPNLTAPLTITSAKPVPLPEAFQILSTTLGLKGYDLTKEGNLMVIRPRNQGGRGRGNQQNNQPTIDWNALRDQMGGQAELKVYPIKYANAASVARTINEVFALQDPFTQLMNQFNSGQFNRGNNRGNQGNRGRFNFPQNLGRGGGQSVRASSDDYSNSVIVNAPSKDQRQVQELIDQIDKQTEQPLKPRVFKLEYASADEIAPVIQNVLTTNAPRGRGGAGNTNVPIEQRFQQAFRFGNAQAAFGTVVAEPRTNSVVVTATEDNLNLVSEVIKELDQEVVYAEGTVVVPLSNARAEEVADLLNRAFGQRQGTGNFRTGGGTGANNRNRQGNRPQNRNQGNLGGGVRNNAGGGRSPGSDGDPEHLELELNDPGAEAGELMTMVEVAQGFPGFFGGGQQRRPTSGQTTDRDAQGRLINVRDLTGQVTIIPDPNTNSLIVVTSPGNAALIQSILEQLDRIPEQVMIETIIVEATLDASTKLGVEWNLVQQKAFGVTGTTGQASQNFGLQTGTTAAQGFRYTLTGGNLTAFLNALQQDQKFEILSTPRIFTSNGVEAQINISQRVPFVVSQREDANGNLTFNYDFEDVGIVLTVTPRITANGQVTMDVNQTANDLQGFTDFNAPIVNQREADTTVSVRDGETIILGGIIRNTVTTTTKKIPLLGDIPILGQFFRSTDRSKGKTELLVFLTPRVVRTPEEAKRLREQEQGRLSQGAKNMLGDKVPPPAKNDGKQSPPPTGGGK